MGGSAQVETAHVRVAVSRSQAEEDSHLDELLEGFAPSCRPVRMEGKTHLDEAAIAPPLMHKDDSANLLVIQVHTRAYSVTQIMLTKTAAGMRFDGIRTVRMATPPILNYHAALSHLNPGLDIRFSLHTSADEPTAGFQPAGRSDKAHLLARMHETKAGKEADAALLKAFRPAVDYVLQHPKTFAYKPDDIYELFIEHSSEETWDALQRVHGKDLEAAAKKLEKERLAQLPEEKKLGSSLKRKAAEMAAAKKASVTPMQAALGGRKQRGKD